MKHLSKIMVPALLLSSTAHAGGLYLYEIATDDVGLAAAGAAARAEDSSVMAANPAALTHVKGKSLTSGFQALYGDTDFDLDDSSLNGPGNTIGFTPIASSFYSQQLNDKWTFGIGLYGNFGLGLDYGNWAGSALLKEIELKALIVQPTVAYKFNDQWSFGAGLGINYGKFSIKNDLISGELDDSDWAFNGKIGVLYEMDENTRFGLAYSSEADFDFEPEFDNIEFDLDATFNAPQQILFSAYHRYNADWAIMGNLGWQDWTEYGKSEINDGTLAPRGKFKDTYHFALGAQYTVSPKLLWNMGVAYDTSMFDKQSEGDITIPTGQAYRIGTGLKYALDDKQSIGVALEGLFIESSRADFGPIRGSYDNPALYFLMMNYSWKSL
ncbi:MAG: OmpP1/FadL family transporter [Vibrio sp.]